MESKNKPTHHIYVCICVCIFVCVHVCIYVCTYTYMYVYVCISKLIDTENMFVVARGTDGRWVK